MGEVPRWVVARLTRRAFDFSGEHADATLEREKNIIADLPAQTLEGTKYVPKATVLESQLLTAGEVLFNNTNSAIWVGKTAVFDGSYPAACSNHITGIKVKLDRAYPEYVAELINMMRRLRYFEILSTKFNNQAGINTDTLASILRPLPSLETQEKMILSASAARAEARRLRAEADALWTEAKARFEAALLG